MASEFSKKRTTAAYYGKKTRDSPRRRQFPQLETKKTRHRPRNPSDRREFRPTLHYILPCRRITHARSVRNGLIPDSSLVFILRVFTMRFRIPRPRREIISIPGRTPPRTGSGPTSPGIRGQSAQSSRKSWRDARKSSKSAFTSPK